MSLIKSKMITDAMPSDETYKKLLEHVGLDQPPVLDTTFS
jgi:hypothetical protein